MAFVEGLLDRGERAVVGRETFDGADVRAFALHGESEAGAHRRTVDEDGARAADAVFASGVGARQAQPVAEEVRQQEP
ncbi:hypothetical protein GCM10027360_22030 [Amycolatopsis echigonensis]